MATQKRRRSRTDHSGVKLLQRPDGTWHAAWRDPATRKAKQQSLTALGLSTHEARRAWAIDKAKSKGKLAAAIASTGAVVAEPTDLEAAIKQFLAASAAKA